MQRFRFTLPASLTRRLLLSVAPAIVVIAVITPLLVGKHSLRHRAALERQLGEANRHLASIESDNQHLLWRIRSMDRDPVVLERQIAEELGQSAEGAVLYRFSDPPRSKASVP